MFKRWFTNIRIFLVWLLGFVLALVILMLGHELLMVFIVNTLKWGVYNVRLMNVIYYMIAGLLCFAYFILVNDYLNRSAKRGLLLKNSLLTIGIQVLIIFLIHLSLLLYGFFPMSTLFILLVIIEGLAGAIMLFFAFTKKKQSK